MPDDDGFAQAAQAWNLAVAQQPVAVVEAADASDVVAVVRAANEGGLVVGAQPGGHGATSALDGAWFGRRHGVAAGALRAVEIVDGTGTHRWVTDESDPELMWALRGGGGEFGIVTRVEIALQAEPELHGGKLMFPAAQARSVLSAFTAVTREPIRASLRALADACQPVSLGRTPLTMLGAGSPLLTVRERVPFAPASHGTKGRA